MDSPQTTTFDGSNWEDLTRLTVQATLAAALDADVADDPTKSAWVAARCTGPALDWIGSEMAADNALLQNYGEFIERLRNAFGVTDQGLHAHRRSQLESLKWQSDLPVFFAEFDRLTTALGVGGHDARIALVRAKLPPQVQKLLAEQALDFANYETMRERLLTMWALDPHRGGNNVVGTAHKKRAKCGRCGKKGHSAPDCRSAKN